MTTKANELIETVRKALEPKYEFPYYALIRVRTRHYGTFHIPAPQCNGMSRRSAWAGSLPIASDKRDGEYYECPFCGEKSFFSGICQDCESDMEEWNEETEEWDQVIDQAYYNHEAVKKAAKEEFLRRLDSGIELGIIYAEIVLPVPWGAEWEPSPFLKSEEWSAERALDKIESIMSTVEKLKDNETFQNIWNEAAEKYTPPCGKLEGEVIEVEGTNEVRRFVTGVWQHMHEGYDYWHPMARVHKESKPSDED